MSASRPQREHQHDQCQRDERDQGQQAQELVRTDLVLRLGPQTAKGPP